MSNKRVVGLAAVAGLLVFAAVFALSRLATMADDAQLIGVAGWIPEIARRVTDTPELRRGYARFIRRSSCLASGDSACARAERVTEILRLGLASFSQPALIERTIKRFDTTSTGYTSRYRREQLFRALTHRRTQQPCRRS